MDFQKQDKQIILCKVPAHTKIKGNEEADKAAKGINTKKNTL